MRKNGFKSLLLFVIGILFGISFCMCIIYINNVDVDVFKNDVQRTNNNFVAMMVETDANSKKYVQSSSNEWLTDGYVFNSTLSGCENGGVISWDYVNKKIVMESNCSDKCYVYFDVYVAPAIPLSEYVLSMYSGEQVNNGLYYHNISLTNGAGDNSYRYAGANPNNYVCFGSDESICPNNNLYRIIGIFDGRVKLIKADYATIDLLGIDGDYKATYSYSTTTYKGSLSSSDIGVYMWNYNNNTTINNGYGSNTWSTSLLNKINLNTNYLKNIGSKWAEMINVTTWKVGGNTYANVFNQVPSVAYQNEIINPVITNSTDNATEYSAKISLMYASDYGFASLPNSWSTKLGYYTGDNNWMYMGLNEWINSRYADSYMRSFLISGAGFIHFDYVSTAIAVRPVFFLSPFVKYLSGSGTSSDPIRLVV